MLVIVTVLLYYIYMVDIEVSVQKNMACVRYNLVSKEIVYKHTKFYKLTRGGGGLEFRQISNLSIFLKLKASNFQIKRLGVLFDFDVYIVL